MDTAKVRRRINALLAKAQHHNTDHEEAQACLAKVAELCTRYNLTRDDESAEARPGTEEAGIRWWEVHVADTGGRGKACAAALAYVIDACAGMSVRGKQRSANGYRMTVVATASAMDLIQELTPVVLDQMHQRSLAACTLWRAEQPGDVSNTEAKHWRDDYIRTFGFGLAERIHAGNRQIKAEGEAGRAAAVVLNRDRERVQRAYQRRYGTRVRTVPAQGVRHAEAAEAGRRDGRTTNPRSRTRT